MWPFKKSKKQPDQQVANTILCIPGNWEDRDDLLRSLVLSSSGEYMAAGNILLNSKDTRLYSFEFCEHDIRMKESFRSAGRVTGIGEDILEGIADHTYVVYISGETGSLEEAEHIAKAGFALLNAGGTGLKVESTGKAFSKAKWEEFMANFEPERHLYDMFVLDSITTDDGTVFSYGMRNIGFKDMIISNEEFADANELLRIFGYYQIVDKPEIKNNQTFQKAAGSPIFRITDELSPPYENNETFQNPFGMWRLTRIIQ
jgi:hypothetical protein